MTKRLVWYFKINRKLRLKDLYDISIYIGNICVQSKIMIRTKLTYLLPPSTVFLVAEKLPRLLRLWNF